MTKDHVNYLNSINSERKNYSLVSKLRVQQELVTTKDNHDGTLCEEKKLIAKEFHKPWSNFTKDAKDVLNQTIISFKQNTRVINKTVNKYQVWKEEDGAMKKITTKQVKGDNWAIRKPMHAETVSGKVFLKRIKQSHITIANAIEQIELIVDKEVKKQLASKIKQYPNNKEGLKKHLKAFPVMINGKTIDKVQIYETIEATATRERNNLDITFDEKKIEKITDTGIQKILLNHLKQEIYQNAIDESGKKIAPHEVAFSEIGIDELNKNIKALNNGKNHQPIKKVRVFEESKRFSLGQFGSKKDKYVETAKGTNLFYAIYADKKENRNYKTIPLNEVIERQKQSLSSALETDENGNRLLFTLSPNDLVYIPTNEEKENLTVIDFDKLSKEQTERIYKFVSCTGGEGHFVSNNYSKEIISNENGSNNKNERMLELNNSNTIYDEKEKPVMIKSVCWKLEVDRLGKIKRIIR